MAKKSNSNNLATKTDLKKLATKEDLRRYATKTELKNVEKSLRREILKVESKVELVEDKVEEAKEDLAQQMKKQHDQVMTAISNFAGRVETLETENSVGARHTRELRVQVDNHETRLTTLESI